MSTAKRSGFGWSVAAALVVAASMAPSAEGRGTATTRYKTSWLSRSQTWTGTYAPGVTTSGHIDTWFQFHPQWNTPEADELFSKAIKSVPPAPPGFTLPAIQVPYPGGEHHGTAGGVTHHVSGILRPAALGRQVWDLTDSTSGNIVPGRAERPQRVAIQIHTFDPWSFGPATSGAIFDGNPDGFDVSFSLLQGTGFPEPYSGLYGDELTPTVMTHSVRVSPGVLNDSRIFWSSPAGAIDLYSVSIVADPAQNISVNLQFGQSTSQFALTFYDWAGLPFDPLNPAALAAIGTRIRTGFVNGTVSQDLSDVFSVGFVPIGLDSYTSGVSSSLDVSDVEVPGPGAAALLGLGGLAIGRRRR